MATTLSGNVQGGASMAYAQPITGLNDLSVNLQDSKSVQYTTGTNTANKANRAYMEVVSLAPGANTTLNLQSLTDQLNIALDFVRIKAVQFHLISTADNADIGSNATSVKIGGASANQALAGNATHGFLGDATDTIRVFDGGIITFASPAAAGVLIDASHQDLFILNEDASNTAKLMVTLIGADA